MEWIKKIFKQNGCNAILIPMKICKYLKIENKQLLEISITNNNENKIILLKPIEFKDDTHFKLDCELIWIGTSLGIRLPIEVTDAFNLIPGDLLEVSVYYGKTFKAIKLDTKKI